MARIKKGKTTVAEILARLEHMEEEEKQEENYLRLLIDEIAAMPAKEMRLRIEARGKLLREELQRRRRILQN